MSFVRTDILHTHKCVHIKLLKDSHSALRALSFKYNVSMQEMFNEFALAIVREDKFAINLVEKIAMKKVNDTLQNKKTKVHKAKNISELDHEALYNLIENSNKNE